MSVGRKTHDCQSFRSPQVDISIIHLPKNILKSNFLDLNKLSLSFYRKEKDPCEATKYWYETAPQSYYKLNNKQDGMATGKEDKRSWEGIHRVTCDLSREGRVTKHSKDRASKRLSCNIRRAACRSKGTLPQALLLSKMN